MREALGRLAARRREPSIRAVLTLSSSAVALACAALTGGGLLLWLSASGRLEGARDIPAALGLVLLSGLLAGLLSRWASARVTGPIRRLERAVKELEAGAGRWRSTRRRAAASCGS